MFKLLRNFLLIFLLVLPSISLLFDNGSSGMMVRGEDELMDEQPDAAQADVAEEDDEEASVASDGQEEEAEEEVPPQTPEEEEEEDFSLRPSPDADTTHLFVKPTTAEFPANSIVSVLVGFTNKGQTNFFVDSMEAGLVHPQDFRYYMLNFTTARYFQTVEPKRQASFEYQFPIREDLADRPFGFIMTLNYSDESGAQFMSVIYNDTINIVEPQEGFDGETFFLYIVLAGLGVLLLVGAKQLLASLGRKHMSKPKPVEMGTQRSDIDYDWVPESTLRQLNGSPKRSPRLTPRQRKSKRNTGTTDE